MIIEDGNREEFKRCLLALLPALPRVGDHYRSSASGVVFEVIGFEKGWMKLVSVLDVSSGMESGLYGIYDMVLNGHLVPYDH